MRNLNPDDLRSGCGDRSTKSFVPPTKIVEYCFYGMGEPLMNYNNVLKAIDKLPHQWTGDVCKTYYLIHFWGS